MRITAYHKERFIENVKAEIPTKDYMEQARTMVQKAAVELLPPKLKALYDEGIYANYFAKKFVYANNGHVYLNITVDNDAFELKGSLLKEVQDLLKLQGEQSTRMKGVETKLRAEIAHVHTDTKLKELYPELIKYMPAEVTSLTPNVPTASSIVSNLKDLGFPKGRD
jgi:hypothetical protein